MSSSAGRPETRSGAGRDRIEVETSTGRRPFMRGILVYGLMARGLPFEEAYAVADAARERLRGRGVVPGAEVGALVEALLRERHLLDAVRPLPVVPAIRVTGNGVPAPFSKGFLSQSLLAAAIEPNDAFDVAREIEGTLVLRGLQEIDRRDLRRLAYQTLERRFGARTAERYLVWRRFQEPDRPVIILLGGPTGAGKTHLALEVARRLGIHHVLSTDAIRQILRIVLTPELVPAIHTSSYEAHRMLPRRPAPGEDPVIEGFLAQAQIVSVGVRAMLDRAIAENASLILDGVSIVPGLIDLSAYRETAHVIFMVVATLDVDAYRARFESRGRESQRAPHRYLENLDSILRIQDHFLELAERWDIPIVDNESADVSVLSILKHVCETLRKVEDFDAKELL